MVLTMPTGWAIREVLMLLVGMAWSAVTLLLAWRGSAVVESLEWWAVLAGTELAVWKIFVPAPPGGEGE